MMRKVLSIAMVLLTILCVNAQMPQPTPLPLNPKVRSGKLPNGLEYFILHNEEPKNRANFYIAQKVGSTLETQEQLGLAHFLEHMAFNGTKNFPGKALLNYLQDKGIRFGSDINAATYFDKTVYNINNVPTTDKNLMDSCLLALHDWSCEIELLDAEIDAERGVIQEEWRSTTDAFRRMMADVAPKIFDEYQYHQMPIGKMEVVMNFPYQTLRDYYHKWYRPDQQGIIVVGDFDVDEMESKVVSLFSTIVMPENAAERTYPTVSKNIEPRFAIYRDKEFSSTVVYVSYKEDPLPREFRTTIEGYVNENLFKTALSRLVNHRLTDFSETAECMYIAAGTYFGNFWVTNMMEAFNINIYPKGNETVKATDQAMAIVSRAFKTGFTESEWEIVRNQIISSYEKAYNERNNTNNEAYCNELVNYFVDGEAAPGIETEYELVMNILPNLPVDVLNQFAATILTDDNQVVVVAQPDKDEITVVSQEEMVASVNNAMHAEYEPLLDEVITEPIIASLPAKGSVTSVEENSKLGTSVITLSNGVKVVVKSTDFAADQIIFQAFREGGKRSYPMALADDVNVMDFVFNCTKRGPFNQSMLRKYLAGKNAALNYGMKNYTEVLSGGSSVRDLPTLMELIYTAFTGLSPDKEYYDIQINNILGQLKMMEDTPEYKFSHLMDEAQYGDNPMMTAGGVKTVENANYDKMFEMLKQSLSNAAEYTMIFVGNVDVETLRPLLEQYISTLPTSAKRKVENVTNVSPILGKIQKNEECKATIPNVYVYNSWLGNNLEYNTANNINTILFAEILNMIYTETLREEEGGTYGAGVGASINPNDQIWQLDVTYQTNKDQYKTLMERSEVELKKLLNEGAPAEKFNRVKENIIKQYEEALRSNRYWSNTIFNMERGFDGFTGYGEYIKNLTLNDFNTWLKSLYDGKYEIEVVLDAQ
ncbi:MAG: insulinase family protein [Bacteroidales bacterium]|nr:insulinase family protein [Bacteroidales bacterium]